MNHGPAACVLWLLVWLSPFTATAQSHDDSDKPTPDSGYAVPNSERFRIAVDLAAGYGRDEAENSRLGYEAQGRIGWAIVSIFGKLSDRFSYRLEINPVDETAPLPACGTPSFFYPNVASNIGPTVRCESDGDKRVDDYKFIALDPIAQQGPIRQAYVDYRQGWFRMRIGRFILPMGFGWQEAGSFTAKDATHIQRINAGASFGAQSTITAHRHDGSELGALDLALVIGDGNRNHDYDYFYFVDPSLDSNSAPTAIVTGRVRPVRSLELRVGYQAGNTGSKVEYFPNYFADKHNDYATLMSGDWRPVHFARVFGEYAQYVWGPTASSAQLVGVDPSPIHKNGYYVGAEVTHRMTRGWTLTVNTTREELSRNDSLIKYLAAQDLYGVVMNKKERDIVLRVRSDVGRFISVGAYGMWLHNPFPQVSGIEAVEGPGAYQSRGSNRWGVVLLAHLP